MSKVPDPEEVAASEKEAAERKAKIETVDLTEKPTPADDRISQANAAAARQEEANNVHADLIAKQEALLVEQTLGGKTEAGSPPRIDENAGAKKLLEGTGMEDMAFPPEKKKD